MNIELMVIGKALHFEGDWETKYGLLIDRLINNTQNSDELIWSEWELWLSLPTLE